MIDMHKIARDTEYHQTVHATNIDILISSELSSVVDARNAGRKCNYAISQIKL